MLSRYEPTLIGSLTHTLYFFRGVLQNVVHGVPTEWLTEDTNVREFRAVHRFIRSD